MVSDYESPNVQEHYFTSEKEAANYLHSLFEHCRMNGVKLSYALEELPPVKVVYKLVTWVKDD